jgi:glyoxylase-like metal-dependent hydrolase (beta-lactamase superfamily II)
MPTVRVDIISIGALARNRLWNETAAVRTPHTTTTLIRSGSRYILVDPGLPAPALAARLGERTGIEPEQIDTVFVSNFRPDHRAGVEAFPRAQRLIHELEQQSVRQHLENLIDQAPGEDIDRKVLQRELALLNTFRPAGDQLAAQVDLFPLFGPTPGNCGLLASLPTVTILLTGDAVLTQDHFLAGQITPDAYDLPAAQESLREVYEIADLIIPSHDNVFLSPRSQGM